MGRDERGSIFYLLRQWTFSKTFLCLLAISSILQVSSSSANSRHGHGKVLQEEAEAKVAETLAVADAVSVAAVAPSSSFALASSIARALWGGLPSRKH